MSMNPLEQRSQKPSLFEVNLSVAQERSSAGLPKGTYAISDTRIQMLVVYYWMQETGGSAKQWTADTLDSPAAAYGTHIERQPADRTIAVTTESIRDLLHEVFGERMKKAA